MYYVHPRSHYCIVGLWTVIMCVRLCKTHTRTWELVFLANAENVCIPCSWSRFAYSVHFRPNPRDSVELNPWNLHIPAYSMQSSTNRCFLQIPYKWCLLQPIPKIRKENEFRCKILIQSVFGSVFLWKAVNPVEFKQKHLLYQSIQQEFTH